MSSVDQAQYTTMEEGDCDWEHGGGGDDWSWGHNHQTGYMTESQNQRAPWDTSPGPRDWMGEPEGGAWSFMSLTRRKQPTVRTMTLVALNRPPGLGIMSIHVAEKKVTNVKNRFTILSEDKSQLCVAGAGAHAHTTEERDDTQREVTANGIGWPTREGCYVKLFGAYEGGRGDRGRRQTITTVPETQTD